MILNKPKFFKNKIRKLVNKIIWNNSITFFRDLFLHLHLKSQNQFIRQAISIGRFKQNPLAETLILWNEDISKNFCLSLNLHPFQKHTNQP